MRSLRALPRAVLVTGATGLVGGGVVERLLQRDAAVHVHALVRSVAGAARLLSRHGAEAARITPVIGDITRPGLGLDAATRVRLGRSVRAVVHAAADTTFSRSLEQARAVNTTGTRHLLALAAEWQAERFVYVSTAYVAGARTGAVAECELSDSAGFVNGYEQSKYEAEQLVRASGVRYVTVRPSAIICDDTSGAVTQYNAVHRALRVFHAGFGALMPGAEATPIDLVTNAYVVAGTVALGFAPDAVDRTYHLCAGTGATALGGLLETAHRIWSRDPDWRRRGILRPVLTDLATYRLFEQSVEETGDVRLATITRSLSHFVPQLAAPKLFDTRLADAALGYGAPAVDSFLTAMIEHLLATRWGSVGRAA